MTAYALLGIKTRSSALYVELYGLVAAVKAGDIAPATAHAFLDIELRKQNRVSFQLIMRHYGAHCRAHE